MFLLGEEYSAIAELATYQRILKKMGKERNLGVTQENSTFSKVKQNVEQKSIDATIKVTQDYFESIVKVQTIEQKPIFKSSVINEKPVEDNPNKENKYTFYIVKTITFLIFQ